MTTDPRTFDDGDYSRMDAKTLIVLAHFYLLFPLRAARHYLQAEMTNFEAANDVHIRKIWNQSAEFALNVTKQNMAHLFRLSGGNGKVIDYFLDWKIRRITIDRILNERLRQFPFSSDLTAFEDRPTFDRVEPIAKVILDEKRVSWANWEDKPDISLQAVDTARCCSQ
jgi:hypothetical protein